MRLNDAELVRAENNFWWHEGLLPPGPFTFILKTYGGATVSATVQDVLRRNNLKVQFKSWAKGGVEEPEDGWDYASALRERPVGAAPAAAPGDPHAAPAATKRL